MAPAPVILVAEDNDGDFVLLRCAFESAALPHKLIGVPTGVDAINYLCADEPFTNRSAYPFPDLVLLDLQMPIMDGIAVLVGAKERIEFSALPIVVLSSIEDPEMIYKALRFGARDFWVKPVTVDERIDMVRVLHSRWLKNAIKPSVGRRWFNSWSPPLPDQKP